MIKTGIEIELERNFLSMTKDLCEKSTANKFCGKK